MISESEDSNWKINATIPSDLKTRYVDIMMPLVRPRIRSTGTCVIVIFVDVCDVHVLVCTVFALLT